MFISHFEGEHYLIRKPLGLANDTTYDHVLELTKDALRLNESTTPANVAGSTNDPNKIHIHIKNCTNAAILELPSDGFTREQRQHGWIMIHVLMACYCFWFLATICNEYFVPAIEGMCCSK